LRLITPKDFRITYDNVANYIKTAIGITFPIRGKSEETNIDNITLGDGVKPDLHLLSSMCLKTFCDKLYRTEDDVTHICTTDSYVYADPIIEYLAGNADSIPTIMRSCDERTTVEQTDEPQPDVCELSSMCVSGRGFYIQPGVNSNSYIKTHYKSILEKTLGYAGFLKHLFSETRCALEEELTPGTSAQILSLTPPPGSPKEGEPTYLKITNIFFTERDCEHLFSNKPGTMGSLITEMPSYRLINFVIRLISNAPIDTTEINKHSYETIIRDLFSLEYKKIVTKVQEYIKDLKQIMNLSLSDKSNIERLIIQLPDLEELLTISTPSFCYENDDSLIVTKDRKITEERSPYWSIPRGAVVQDEKMVLSSAETPTFNNVTFSSKGIQITGCNDVFKKMVVNQINKEYTLSGDTIYGPITLELICKLRGLDISADDTTKAKVIAIINDQIENIITDFCKTSDLACDSITEVIRNEKREREDTSAATSSETSRMPNALFQYNAESLASISGDILSEPLSETRKTKKRKGGSRCHKKASRKRNGRKILHRTRKYKHH
jgi:hypothetical protein